MAKRVHFIGPDAGDFADAEIEYLARYFASAGSIYPAADKPAGVFFVPWAWGPELRRYWLAARAEVARRVPARAVALMDKYLDIDGFDGPDGPARQVELWPTAARRELAELLRESDD